MRDPDRSPQPLTQREEEVLAYAAQGMRDKEIARRLGIEPRTVEQHVRKIVQKLGVRTRGEAVAFYYRRIIEALQRELEDWKQALERERKWNALRLKRALEERTGFPE